MNIQNINVPLATALFVLTSGCTTAIETRPIAPSTPSVRGTEYSIPALEIELVITRRLVDCASKFTEPRSGQTPTPESTEQVKPKFEFKVEAKQEFVAAEAFEMDYTKLSKGMKESTFKVEWHENRMLKSFNATATDKSSEIALETLKAGVAIAKLAGGIPPTPGLAGGESAKCPKEVEIRKNLLDKKKTATANLTDSTAIVADYQKQDASALSESAREKLQTELSKVKKYTKAITDIDKELAKLDKILAFEEPMRWRPNSSAGATAGVKKQLLFRVAEGPQATIRQASRGKWLKRLFGVSQIDTLGRGGKECEKGVGKDGLIISFMCRLERSLSLVTIVNPEPINSSEQQLSASRNALGIKAPTSKSKKQRDHVRGVVTRIPVRGRFFVCSGIAQVCQRSSSGKLIDELITIPQLGRYLTIPFTNGFGQDNELSVEFAKNGLPTMVEYKEKQAAGLVAAQTITQGTEQLIGYAAEVRTFREAKKAEQEGAALKALEAERKLLEEQKKIVELEAAINPANADLAAQKARLEERLAILKVERDIVTVQDEIDTLENKLSITPNDLALQAERDRLAAMQAIMQSRATILRLCLENDGLEGCVV